MKLADFKDKFPILLAVLLYVLIYLVRFQQGGFQFQIEVFKELRRDIDKQISEYLPSPQAELLSGILLGQNKTLPGDLRLALRDTSTLHMVVASGQNLSMLAGFFMLMAGIVKRKTAIILTLLAVVLYVILTGAQIPILRAALMVSLTFLAQALGRDKDSYWILLVSAGFLLLINPQWLFELSFQLSVLATAGVVVVAPILLQKFKKIPLVSQDLSVSLGAQLMVMPIIIQNFHQLSLVALPANLMVLWTIPFIMIGGAILIVLAFITPPLALLFSYPLSGLLTYFLNIVYFFTSFNWSWIYIGEMSWLVWSGYYLLIIAWLNLLNREKN